MVQQKIAYETKTPIIAHILLNTLSHTGWPKTL